MSDRVILAITSEGLIYRDEHGNEHSIDFAECFANYVRRCLSPERWERYMQANQETDADWGAYVERVNRWREVAVRNILPPPWADGPYIEFYTDPPTRFKFATEEEFQQTRQAIELAGWTTFDQS